MIVLSIKKQKDFHCSDLSLLGNMNTLHVERSSFAMSLSISYGLNQDTGLNGCYSDLSSAVFQCVFNAINFVVLCIKHICCKRLAIFDFRVKNILKTTCLS